MPINKKDTDVTNSNVNSNLVDSDQYLTPKEIVTQLDRFIVGQYKAKKAVAIAIRNRWRRKRVKGSMRDEIKPKNILMIGPTGVGKTEIARRLATFTKSPFVKVEATKFTEIGYVGGDAESAIRDLVEMSIKLTRERFYKQVENQAKQKAYERILEVIIGKDPSDETKEKFLDKLEKGEIDDQEIEIKVAENISTPSPFDFSSMSGSGSAMGVINLTDVLGKAMGHDKLKLRKITVLEAKNIIMSEESSKLSDEEKIVKSALSAAENEGIVFIDEIDKISGRENNSGSRGEVSREGVQRDLLPILEGTSVNTKYGIIKTDHILFIASGAFHMSKPSDLLPELQGRLPIRVELDPLNTEDLERILKEPESSLIKQYMALIDIEGIELKFTNSAIKRIAEIAADINKNIENIGARRLHTIMEKVLEDISFEASDMKKKSITIDDKYIDGNIDLQNIASNTDLSKFIL